MDTDEAIGTDIAGQPAGVPPIVQTLAYPISPEYVKAWTPVRGLCELIANALDEDPHARVGWSDGILTIADDGPGIPEEGLVLGYTSKTARQIGQFGEGKKLAMLILARSSKVGAVRCDTVGYGFVPTVQRRRLLADLVPSRTGQGAEVLVYHLFHSPRSRGTLITVACPQALADEAIGRFRALTEPGYTPPPPPGVCVLDGPPGRIWIGGVLVTTMPGLLASYDLPLTDKGLQNRDRTVIEAGALRDALRTILAASRDPQVIDRFATHVLDGGTLREPEQFFTAVKDPRARAAWRAWAGAHLPANTFYTRSGNEEAALDLADRGFTEITADGLSPHEQLTLMALLGVEVARVRQHQHYAKTQDKTTWLAARSLTTQQRSMLADARHLVQAAIGAFAVDRVRVYERSEAHTCTLGFYQSRTGDIALHRDAFTDRHVLLGTLLHEAAHRVAHRGGGRFTPVPDYGDRSLGFEDMLTEFGALLLAHLADSNRLPDPTDPASPADRDPHGRLAEADDPAVPVSRRELAHLLNDRLLHALTARGYASVKDLVASTAVHPEYWKTLTRPRPAGYRRAMGAGGRAWNYDKVALLAEAVGVHAAVVWLGYNLCEGAMHGRRRDLWGKPGPWAKQMRETTLRACTDLAALGGHYAAQIPALHALIAGDTPAPTGDDRWQAPARNLIALERQRLGLDPPAPPT